VRCARLRASGHARPSIPAVSALSAISAVSTLFVTVAERNDARFPASTVLAAAQGPHPVKKLVVRIGLPMRRLAPARYHHARTIDRRTGPGLDRRCQMHQQRDRAQDALRMIDEADQLSQVGLAAQIYDVSKRRMHMSGLPDLDEQDAPAEM